MDLRNLIAETEVRCLLLFYVVNVGGLGYDHSRLGTAAPPSVGVDDVILDGNVVPMIHSDAAVGAVVDVVVVDVDVVTFNCTS